MPARRSQRTAKETAARPFFTLEWTGRHVRLLDQTLLPRRVRYLSIRDEKAMFEAIRALRVRGAPAIGVAAAYGLYLGTRNRRCRTAHEVRRHAASVAVYLGRSRPTAVNLFWALDRCAAALDSLPGDTDAEAALDRLLEEARAIEREDEETCEAIGRNGAPLLRGLRGVLTHCNAGALATAGQGTALSLFYTAARRQNFTVYVDETRPLLQGARLTAWELRQAGLDVRLITDNTAGTVLQRGMAGAVVVGADRIAANGDVANKIGTMPLAIVARYYKVPFYVAAPLSTLDPATRTGRNIPIEERGAEEVTRFGGTPVAPPGTRVFSPAFDVTPARLVTAIVTEAGVLRPPYRRSFAGALRTRG